MRTLFNWLLINAVFIQSALAGGVTNGQPVNASVTNAAFLYKNDNDTSPYTYTLGGVNITGLTASRACVTDASKNLASSATTATQLGYLSSATGTTGTTSTNIVFSTSPTLTTPTLTGPTISSGNTTFSALTASTVPYLDASKVLTSSAVTPTQLGYLSGATGTTGTTTTNLVFSASPTFTGTVSAAAATFTGRVGIANAAGSGALLSLDNSGNQSLLSGTTQIGAANFIAGTSAATSQIDGYRSSPATQAAAFTSTLMTGFNATGFTAGAGSTITRAVSYFGSRPTVGTNNAFIADNSSFSGNYFINQSGTETSNMSGRLVKGAADSGFGIWEQSNAAQTLLSGTTQVGIAASIRGNSSATSRVIGVSVEPRTEATAFTTGALIGVRVLTPTVGAGSTATRNIGLAFQGVGTSGTNNAYITDNESFSGNWFINQSGTDSSRFSGKVGIGADPTSGASLYVAASNLSGVNQYTVHANSTFSSGATSTGASFTSAPASTATAYTMSDMVGFYAIDGSKGSGSTITNQHGVYVSNLTAGTNNYGINLNVSSGSNKWNVYAAGTAANYFGGSIATARADVASAATITALSSTTSFVKLTGATATTIQGITAGNDGQIIRIYNATGSNMTIAHENAGATAANRITTMTGADVSTTGNGFAELIYDTGSSRWIASYVTP